jgi:hypothetical protein
MSGGCTSCGRKEGCGHRKAGMFAAIDQALARWYPSGRWGERSPLGLPPEGPDDAPGLRDRLGERLSALCVHVPGRGQETCAYLYVLCTGRPPALIELREGLADPPEDLASVWEELYLRVSLSSLARFAAVQQVTLRAEMLGDRLWVEEAPRAGVFDPLLLPRFRKLVAVLAELGIQNLDCGDICEPPAGFDPGLYRERYREQPGIINYLFYPQPAASVRGTLVRLRPPPSHARPPRPAIPDRRSARIE